MNNSTVNIVVIILGVVVGLATIGMVVIAVLGDQPPAALITIASTAVTALVTLLVATNVSPSAPKLQLKPPPRLTIMGYTATVKKVWLPARGHFVHFQDRHKMRKGHPIERLSLYGHHHHHHPPHPRPVPVPPTPTPVPPAPVPVPPPVVTPPGLPIDWAKALTFPMDGNDAYGDCMAAAACHCDNTWTGNVGTESTFDLNALEQQYLQASGGDNGLDESMLAAMWAKGLTGVPAATILARADVDPTNETLMQTLIHNFGGVVFMFDVPDAWVQNFNTGCTWDAPAVADQNNGHGVLLNGVDVDGSYHLVTWGTYCWLTPAGVAVCLPSAFAVFSLRWFNAQGIAPNGQTYAQLAALWMQMGGPAVPTAFPGVAA